MIVCAPPDHCQCRACAPAGTFPDGPPERPDHIGARVVQCYQGKPWHKAHAFLNGEDISRQCVEACPGARGFVVVATLNTAGKLHRCRNCPPRQAHACMRVVIGDVRLALFPD